MVKAIPQDFHTSLDIHVDAVRTPTAHAPAGPFMSSGRRLCGVRPRAADRTFYFSGQPPAAVAQTIEELDQMKQVLLFREGA